MPTMMYPPPDVFAYDRGKEPIADPLTWPDPRDLTARLEDGEMHGSLFALLDWPDYFTRIPDWLDGVEHKYVIRTRFQERAIKGDNRSDFVGTGTVQLIKFGSSARNWDEFRRDYYVQVRKRIQIMQAAMALRRAAKKK